MIYKVIIWRNTIWTWSKWLWLNMYSWINELGEIDCRINRWRLKPENVLLLNGLVWFSFAFDLLRRNTNPDEVEHNWTIYWTMLNRVQACGEQYVFLGNPPPFNGGWHFTALDDFEHVLEQGRLNPSWRGIRVWHKVNFVPSITEQGEPALVPKEKFPSMWVTVDGRIFQCHVVS